MTQWTLRMADDRPIDSIEELWTLAVGEDKLNVLQEYLNRGASDHVRTYVRQLQGLKMAAAAQTVKTLYGILGAMAEEADVNISDVHVMTTNERGEDVSQTLPSDSTPAGNLLTVLLNYELSRMSREERLHPLSACIMNVHAWEYLGQPKTALAVCDQAIEKRLPGHEYCLVKRASLLKRLGLNLDASAALAEARRRLSEVRPRTAGELLARILAGAVAVVDEARMADHPVVATLGDWLQADLEALDRVEHGQANTLDALAHTATRSFVKSRTFSIVHSSLGISYSGLERHAEAAECFRRALQLDPEQPVVWMRLAHAEFELGEREEAYAHAHRYLDAVGDEASPETLMIAGHICMTLERLEEAKRWICLGLSKQPENVVGVNNLGLIAELEGNFAEARRLYSRALQLAPGHPVITQSLARVSQGSADR